MNRIVMMLTALLINAIAGATVAHTVGLSPLAGALGVNAVAVFARTSLLGFCGPVSLQKSGRVNW